VVRILQYVTSSRRCCRDTQRGTQDVCPHDTPKVCWTSGLVLSSGDGRGLPDTGRLVACEVDQYVADLAQALFQASPQGAKNSAGRSSARDTKLAAAQESFDLVFIDADKQEYAVSICYRACLPHGFICVDNTRFPGQPYLPQSERTQNGEAIAEFNRSVKMTQEQVLPVRDGLTIIRRVLVG